MINLVVMLVINLCLLVVNAGFYIRTKHTMNIVAALFSLVAVIGLSINISNQG